MTPSVAEPWVFAVFLAIVLMLLVVDLGVFHRRAHAVRLREALAWNVVWVVLSASFGFWVYSRFGAQAGLEFFTGYIIEYALSVDNIFVFVLLFSYFSVPPKLHHRVLFWGILGAVVMRGAFIFAGTALLHAFHWIIYVFGAFLIFTGFKILQQKGDSKIEPDRNPVLRLFQRIVPMSSGYEKGGFFVRRGGKIVATPLALVLVTVETTDLIFAVDSIPAIFGVTTDWFIVFTSNICAILGLRSMYFLLAAVVDRFVYLGMGLGLVLMFVGAKMLLGSVFPIDIRVSLLVVALILTGAILLSILPSGKSKR
jgi:tellurite resistance protein TerC